MNPPTAGPNSHPPQDGAPADPSPHEEREHRLDVAIRELLEARESGVELDRATWLDRYPDLAPDLTEFLETSEQVGGVIDRAVSGEPAAGGRFGPYRTVRLLGKGGMGFVYEVEEEPPGTGRRLALKVLPAFAIPDPEARERFWREAEAVARLDHPHVVPILMLDRLGETPFILMPLVDGPDLRTVRRRLGGPRDPAVERDAEDRPRDAYIVRDPDRPEDRAELGSADSHARAVAMVGLQAARALDHVHQGGILHRDVKPSNLLLDSAGTVFLTDFGLAGRVDLAQADLTATGDLAGTLRYLAPERLHRWCDPRSDVYSLGLTLYELLTLRPAFDEVDRGRLLQAVERTEPPAPRKLRSDIPRDLETIVLKAIEKEPSYRYQSAGDLAEDLRRFLDGQPIRARRAGPLEQTWKWSQRHRNVVASGLATLVAILLVLSISVVLIRIEQKKALDAARVASQDRLKAIEAADLASQEREKAQDAARDSRYESQAQRLLRILWTNHARGWSDEVKSTIDGMAAIRQDEGLEGLFLASLPGLDLRFANSIVPGGGTIAFGPKGRRLLVSGFVENGFRGDLHGTTVWDLKERSSVTAPIPSQPLAGPKSQGANLGGGGGFAEPRWISTIRDPGSLAFRPDGTPLQLTADGTRALRLWDVSRDRVIATFPIPIVGATGSEPANDSTTILDDFTLTPDGRLISASVQTHDSRAWVFVWEAASREKLLQLPGRAQTLAFTPDGSLLAGGSDDGKIHVWSILDGTEINKVWAGESRIRFLAFGPQRGRDFRPLDAPAHPGRGWWLAATDLAGKVTVWDTETGALQFKGTGGSERVFSAAFSPDGTLLASGGQGGATVWDVNRGRELLAIGGPGHPLTLAFTPDGRQLAAGLFEPKFSVRGEDSSRVGFWTIEDSRGIRTLRGLADRPMKLVFARDGRYLAALGHDWRVAIWERATGVLKLVLEPPEGLFPEHAALAFSPDGRRLAFSSFRSAMLWDLETGRQLAAWSLPEAVLDFLGFQPSGKLHLFRIETKPGTRGPFRDAPYEQFPRVGRIRELLGSGQTRTIAEIDRFNRHVFDVVAADDLSYLAIDGVTIDTTGTHRSVAAFEGRTGRTLWSISQPDPQSSVSLSLEPSGQLLGVQLGDNERPALYKIADGTRLGTIRNLGIPSQGWRLAVVGRGLADSKRTVFDVLRGSDGHRLFTLGAETLTKVGGVFRFSPDGRALAWTHEDGTVALADLHELNILLTRLGLGWKEED